MFFFFLIKRHTVIPLVRTSHDHHPGSGTVLNLSRCIRSLGFSTVEGDLFYGSRRSDKNFIGDWVY